MRRIPTHPWRLLGFAMLLVAAAGSSRGATKLMDVRVGPHKRFDRVVFEFEHEVQRRLVALSPQVLEVRFSDVSPMAGFSLRALPHGLSILNDIDYRRDGASGMIFRLTLRREASPSELILPGHPWRLAVDVAARVVESRETKPEYVPGDQPIPTTFAEQVHGEMEAIDPTHLRAVLAYYYAERHDTALALREAELYRDATGFALGIESELRQAPASPTAPTPVVPTSAPRSPWWSPVVKGIPSIVGYALVFKIGLLLGIFGSRWIRNLKLPTIRLRRHRLPKTATQLADVMERGLEDLQAVVARKKAPRPAPTPAELSRETKPDSESLPAEVGDDEIRESLMDRRVRRVLDLSGEGRSIVEIAESLEMGQDEVKLILDLNK